MVISSTVSPLPVPRLPITFFWAKYPNVAGMSWRNRCGGGRSSGLAQPTAHRISQIAVNSPMDAMPHPIDAPYRRSFGGMEGRAGARSPCSATVPIPVFVVIVIVFSLTQELQAADFRWSEL